MNHNIKNIIQIYFKMLVVLYIEHYSV